MLDCTHLCAIVLIFMFLKTDALNTTTIEMFLLLKGEVISFGEFNFNMGQRLHVTYVTAKFK